MEIKNFVDGLITLSDGTGVPNTFAVPFTNGDFSASGLAQLLREVAAYETRGVLNSLRHTTRRYPSGSFTVQLDQLFNGTADTLIDFVSKTGNAAAYASTSTGDVYTLDVRLFIDGSALGDATDQQIDMTDTHITIDIAEGDPSSVTVNYICYGTITRTAP
jgi:hypothetical protein